MKISVILPVLNESARLEAALRRLRASAAPGDLEIIVVDGGSVDGTADVARAVADRVLTVTPPGRARQMHHGALAAEGDWLLFLHADTTLPKGWAALLTQAARSTPPAVWTAFPVSFDRPGRAYRWIERATAWRLRWTGVPHGDQAVAVRRDDYIAVGGYPDVPLMEEYYLARRLKPRAPVRMLSVPVVTSARRYEKNGPLRNAIRNSILVALYHLGVPARRLARLYR